MDIRGHYSANLRDQDISLSGSFSLSDHSASFSITGSFFPGDLLNVSAPPDFATVLLPLHTLLCTLTHSHDSGHTLMNS